MRGPICVVSVSCLSLSDVSVWTLPALDCLVVVAGSLSHRSVGLLEVFVAEEKVLFGKEPIFVEPIFVVH